MKTFVPIISNLSKEERNPEEMGPLMKAIKAVHAASTSPTAANGEELIHQRAEIERFSRLATPVHGIEVSPFVIGDMKCERVSPDHPHRTDRIIMYCHGGGYTCGGLGYARILAAKLAIHTGLEVVSFEYGLAPENPYPAPIEDGIKVWDYLMYKGYGAKDIIIAGDSAGGNMALEICLSLKESERKLPKAMVLMSPWTDMRATNNSYETYKDKDPLLTYEYVVSVRHAYAGEREDYSDPHLSPLKADLLNFPPALIQVGSNEILRDDSEKLSKQLIKCGVMAKLEIYSGGWHVFQQMPFPKAAAALDAVNDFLLSLN